MQERLTAYTNVIAEKEGISYIKTIGFHSEHAAAVSAIESFISDNIKLDSIFFATSYLADAGLEAIKNLGMSIPDQLGVIVFDDYRLFRLFTPPITAISQPIKELSETIIKLLLDKLSSSQKVSGHQTIEISTELIIRESSSSSERHL
jgi:LacI family transcriptional regulator